MKTAVLCFALFALCAAQGGGKPIKMPVYYNPIRLVTNGAETITSQSGGDYVAEMTLGTPAQTVYAILDSGSSNLVVAGSNFGLTDFPPYYHATSSTTSDDTGATISIPYGSADISGVVYKDYAGINGISAGDVSFMVITQQDNFFQNGCANSGLVGLAFRSIAENNIEPLLDTLYAAGKIPENSFSLQLCRSAAWRTSQGHFVIGGTDSTLYTGPLYEIPLTPPGGVNQYYSITVDSTVVAGTTVLGSSAFIVDSGTNSLLLATSAFESFVTAAAAAAGVSSSDQAFSGGGLFCNTDLAKWPDITFTVTSSNLDSFAMAVPAEHYMEPFIQNGGTCYLLRVSDGSTTNLVGTPLLNTYYAYYNKNTNSVSFAAIANCVNEPGPPPPFPAPAPAPSPYTPSYYGYSDEVKPDIADFDYSAYSENVASETIIVDTSSSSSSSPAVTLDSVSSNPAAAIAIAAGVVVVVAAAVIVAVMRRRSRFAAATAATAV